jgi:hypothetical protein
MELAPGVIDPAAQEVHPAQDGMGFGAARVQLDGAGTPARGRNQANFSRRPSNATTA